MLLDHQKKTQGSGLTIGCSRLGWLQGFSRLQHLGRLQLGQRQLVIGKELGIPAQFDGVIMQDDVFVGQRVGLKNIGVHQMQWALHFVLSKRPQTICRIAVSEDQGVATVPRLNQRVVPKQRPKIIAIKLVR